MAATYLILGAGYTGARVARRLAARGEAVLATTRHPGRLESLAEAGVTVVPLDLADAQARAALRARLPAGVRVLHSIPTLRRDGRPFDPTPWVLDALGDRPARLVYLSTTGVYGTQGHIDETTPPRPATERQRLRLAAERQLRAGPWSTLILRPAAIYGPGRGLHVALREGRYRLPGDGAAYSGSVHVDDLAALAVAALDADLTGAYPVADAGPATRRERAAFAADLLGLPLPPSVPLDDVHETQRQNRFIDARAVWEKLGVTMRYPTFREGIPACLAEEAGG
ncbi:NAD(P)H-binding protein [Rhodocaloribacter litoris]|uniref:NAD-dependent epimerase/dehydratase family protein n=1 Tax=Rhodocaloribacter litoris TaxID=2558931 RepID=UPI001E2E6238|nr:NAD-dependent epimerase/dehydratase family protein [Rhodocaloribacter litoris]QXD16893.1 NAD(P)H-binding protein [Rhodocaloribacter litoris]